MERLFSYGSLRDEKVQRAIFGHPVEGVADAITGYRLAEVVIDDATTAELSGTNVHRILDPTDNVEDRIEGLVLSLTDDELQLADDYEDAAYKRVSARLASGGEAWVYVRA